jgi:uncharacterized protein YndB with AHSA1/START domain
VEIRSDRHYRFDATPSEVWDALARVEQYPTWWPWLREFDGVALRTGETWRCVVKPPLPYTVRFAVELTDVVDRHLVRARITGDITGTARLVVTDLEPDRPDGTPNRRPGCELMLNSALDATGGMPRLVARVLRPVATMGHDWVLDTGARQFGSVLTLA